MGSCTFDTVVWGVESAEEAYNRAYEEATHEFGHEPYNGTISTTCGFVLSPYNRPEKPHLYGSSELVSVFDDRVDHLHKWDVCEAIRVQGSRQDETANLGHARVELVLPRQEYEAPNSRENIVRALDAWTTRARRARTILPVSNYGERESTDVAIDRDIKLTLTGSQVVSARVDKVAATKGKTETRFFVLHPDRHGHSRMPEWDSGFPTQAAARAALPAPVTGYETYEIISMTRRASGEPLVRQTSAPDRNGKVTLEVSVNVYRVLKKGGPVEGKFGWLFYGWAAT